MSILPIAGAILLAVSQTDASTIELAMVLGCIGIAFSLSAAADVFDFRRLSGPARMNPDDRVSTLWFVLFFGFGCWIFAQSLYISSRPGAATQPSTQSGIQFSPDQVIATSIGQVALMLALVVTNLAARPGGLRRLGFDLIGLVRSVKPVVVGVAIVVPLMYAVMVCTQSFWDWVGYSHPTAHPLLEFMRKQPDSPLTALAVISALFLAPPAEEILFRGHLQTGAVYGLNLLLGHGVTNPSPRIRAYGVILTSIAFTAVHQPWMAPPILVLSLALGYAYERTGNLWVPILIHTTFNAFNLFNFWSQLSNH